MSGGAKLIYARGELSADQVQAEIAKFWQDLDSAGDSELEARLTAAGLDGAAFDGVDKDSAITVQPGTSGVDPIGVVVVVTLANRIVGDLWEKVLLPRIRRRWGDDAIGDRKQGED